METWLFFAILSAFTAGVYNFSLKVISHRNYNTSLISIYSYKIGLIIIGSYLFLNPSNLFVDINDLKWILIFAAGNTFFFFLSLLSRVVSMKNIHSVLFFPIYKTLGPILVTFVSIYFFKESLSFKEMIGIIIGITVPLLLITRAESKIQKNLFNGIVFALLTAILTAISTFFAKQLMVGDFNIALYLFFSCAMGVMLSYGYYRFTGNRVNESYNGVGIKKFAVLVGILHILSYYTFIVALEGNLAIVFTINSFSILIPIILSIFFYKEHFNIKKGLVIFLSIVSILLFI